MRPEIVVGTVKGETVNLLTPIVITRADGKETILKEVPIDGPVESLG